MINWIQEKLASYRMAQALQAESRDVDAINITKAKSMALLFNAENSEQLKQAKELIVQLKKSYPNLTVYALGWKRKINPESTPNADFKLFSKNDYNFFYKPKDTELIREFKSRDYDIILDLSMDFVYPIKRLLLELNTSLRVGLFSKHNEMYFDLFINSSKNVSEFAKQAIYYLGILNS